ncbi:uncharacterized protein Pyn_30523 [Prunus yedoensis var. nudiflora]|uniref:DUF4378 domain-containing protein n=1 Tax=Prunus yedoensis var. nudiflora TaxID=2094558 RepID=A0A314XFN0_PRUYE|nr:uncharacterized protein Pyn_30523 [Prunus yedoensis var. nudiflora]
MNDSTGKTGSSLTIAEKKTHRPGGCVGIFFQLFDWNRRFAKKKLFSKKLLPPSRAKQVSKKFRDEKMPNSKLHLIADENSGGFPNVKKNVNRSVDFEHKHELRAPSLVARLMGLESMPATREKPKKASFTDACDSGEKTFLDNHSGSDRAELNLETGNAKSESRPQKLQKMGPYEKSAVTRFGAEALQIKSVLSRSRKHHPKLASPVKSPRIPSGKNASRTSRLIDAATRILEPGLQSTNRAKCAITYSSSFDYPSVDEVLADGTTVQSPEISSQACYNVGASNSLMSQTSCKSCGNLVDVVDLRSKVEEQQPAFPSLASNIVNGSSLVAEQNKPRSSMSSFGQEKDAIFQGTRNQPISVSGQKGSLGEPVTERKSMPPEGQASWQLSSQPCKPQSEDASSITLKNRRASSAANAVRETKDFVALNRNLSSRAQPRVPTKANDSKFDTERKAFTGKDDYPSQLRTTIRKRRMINVSGQVESSGFVSSTSTRQVNYQFDVPTQKGLGNGARLMNTSPKSKLPGQREGNRANGNKDTDVISFTFNSPIRNKTGIPTQAEGPSMDNGTKPSFQKPLSLSGDAIGAFLEQKFRELACQEDDDLATGASSKRSTAMILQELISALTADHSLSHDGHMANADVASPAQRKTDRSVGIFHHGDSLSPGSVLEASFSSSSLDDSSGHRSFYPHSMDYSDDQLQLGHYGDLIDSATSVDRKKTGSEMMTALVNNVSRILHSINAGGERLRGDKLTHANEVILKAELLFGNVTLHKMDVMKGLFISPLLLDLETIASSMMKNFDVLSSLGDTKEGTKLSEFLFDCVIEHLDSKYGRYCNSGFRFWEKLPLCMNRKLMIQEVEDEMQKWTDLAGMIPDEMIEWDMNHALGKWTDFNIEAFEAGSEIDGDILQSLVNEVVMDLRECRPGSL